eukprot:m.1313530 g.1313530  ORF g.1313530 m.1313530 type:complete len:669 (-) comp24835_c0_seq13:4092-6098(-)
MAGSTTRESKRRKVTAAANSASAGVAKNEKKDPVTGEASITPQSNQEKTDIVAVEAHLETPVVEIAASGIETPSLKKSHAEEAFDIISRIDFAKAEKLLLDDESGYDDKPKDCTVPSDSAKNLFEENAKSNAGDTSSGKSTTTEAQWEKMRSCLAVAMMEVDTLADVLGVMLGTPHLNTEQVMEAEPVGGAAMLRKQYISRRAMLSKVGDGLRTAANKLQSTVDANVPFYRNLRRLSLMAPVTSSGSAFVCTLGMPRSSAVSLSSSAHVTQQVEVEVLPVARAKAQVPHGEQSVATGALHMDIPPEWQDCTSVVCSIAPVGSPAVVFQGLPAARVLRNGETAPAWVEHVWEITRSVFAKSLLTQLRGEVSRSARACIQPSDPHALGVYVAECGAQLWFKASTAGAVASAEDTIAHGDDLRRRQLATLSGLCASLHLRRCQYEARSKAADAAVSGGNTIESTVRLLVVDHLRQRVDAALQRVMEELRQNDAHCSLTRIKHSWRGDASLVQSTCVVHIDALDIRRRDRSTVVAGLGRQIVLRVSAQGVGASRYDTGLPGQCTMLANGDDAVVSHVRREVLSQQRHVVAECAVRCAFARETAARGLGQADVFVLATPPTTLRVRPQGWALELCWEVAGSDTSPETMKWSSLPGNNPRHRFTAALHKVGIPW